LKKRTAGRELVHPCEGTHSHLPVLMGLDDERKKEDLLDHLSKERLYDTSGWYIMQQNDLLKEGKLTKER
jgi:hypothetical protein